LRCPTAFREASGRQFGFFVEKSHEAARAGADIVLWSEAAVGVVKEDEPTYVTGVQEAARGDWHLRGRRVLHGYGSVPGGLAENKLIWVDPRGR
jgi:hypothetical protein